MTRIFNVNESEKNKKTKKKHLYKKLIFFWAIDALIFSWNIIKSRRILLDIIYDQIFRHWNSVSKST